MDSIIMKTVTTAITLLCLTAAAQSPLGLQYPLGIPDLAVTGSAAAMGGSGTAVAEEFIGTSLNPANAAIGTRSAFSAMVSFDITHISDNGASSTVSGYTPKLLSLILPVGAAGNLAFSMQRRYDANLNFYTTTALADVSGPHTATIKLNRTGGLTAWQGGWAYRFRNGLGLGLLYERLYFNRESREVFESTFRYNLDNGLATFPVTFRSSVTETEHSNFASDGIRFGMQVPVSERFTLGAAAEYILPGNGTVRREYVRLDATTPIETSEGTFSVNLPPSINFGAAYAHDERWLFAADVHATLWELYENDSESHNTQRVYGVSAGARFIPSTNKLSAQYWEKIHYSAGLRYSSLPYDNTPWHFRRPDLTNRDRNLGAHDYGFTLGVGLPIPNDGGMVDIVFDIGRRTDARHPGYSENVIKFQLGINGGRNWFQNE
jgi:hypothetical protein